ncbi:hypothetical protein [Actinoalloteichus hymeniacidonis]|uniref:Uncharacterized protein n=1 Tax=Actinoalloteichus hymeniacidonis TaxID=340345 RepID=A0AAC9HN45_9PSEU|nr:hypothetical protein [Actinoalloteichus hymeniacidonis]AOS62208.1 hypothetical protein TL08_06935 [Actinoalloteichus hymeniacidonis]MBB5909767.1 membrane-associated HD superfamily phosphohydrolase [Actinoalloteichus hymeniacidonis]
MPEPETDRSRGEDLRDVLRRWEAERGPRAPGFPAIRRRISAQPSPLVAPRWTAGRSLRLAGALAWAQLRVVPWLVLPIVLVTVTMAVLAARFLGVSQSASAALSGFCMLMLLGVAATVTMALSPGRADTVSLSTPLGPQVVLMARIGVVLVLDAIAGTAASALVSAWGYTGGLAAVLAGWLAPLAVIAGVATFMAIWAVPWAGMIAGLVVIPLVTPASNSTTSIGLGAFSGAVWEAITPAGVAGVGLLILAAAVLSARSATALRGGLPEPG